MSDNAPNDIAAEANDLTDPPFYLIVTFWGDVFRRLMCDYSISSLLAENNIPTLKDHPGCKFVFCTTPEDWEKLNSEPFFKILSEHIETVFLEEDKGLTVDGSHKMYRYAQNQKKLAQYCFDNKAASIFINPDSVYPDGSIREARRIINDGAKVVLCTAVRFRLEGVTEYLEEGGYMESVRRGEPLVITRREAVHAGLTHMHPETQCGNWDSPRFGELAAAHEREWFGHAICCFWPLPRYMDLGVIICTHNWCPLAVNYAALKKHRYRTLDGRSFDGEYIHENFKDADWDADIHVVSDSDSLFMLGMTPENEMVPVGPKWRWWKRWPFIGEWSKGYILNQTVFDKNTDALRRKIYPTLVRWHPLEIGSDWEPVWEYTENWAKRVLSRYLAYDMNVNRPGSRRWSIMNLWHRFLFGATAFFSKHYHGPLYARRFRKLFPPALQGVPPLFGRDGIIVTKVKSAVMRPFKRNSDRK